MLGFSNMKRDLSQLTKEDIEEIEEWLSKHHYDAIGTCPFINRTRTLSNSEELYNLFCKRTCYKIFPSLDLFSIKRHPCGQYSYKYVRRVAREVVKKWKEDNK